MPQHTVAVAAELRPAIFAARAETEAQRKLPGSVVTALINSQLFRLAIPSDLGGLELDPVVALETYEEIAKAEASAAWLVWNSSLPCLLSRFLSDSVRKEVFADRGSIYTSSTRPTGRAVLENGSYRLSGHWSLVSGCMHATWLGLMYLVEKDGEVEMIEPGVPHMRMALVPAGSYEILDTWHVGGLRGTGSHDVVVEDLEVPVDKTFTPMGPSHTDRAIGRIPIACTMSAGHAAICLGIAGAALETLLSLGPTKVSVDPGPGLPDRASNQFIVAQAATKIAAHRVQLHNALAKLWERAENGTDWTVEDVADVWSAAVTTGRECRSLVTAMYEAAGTPSLYVDCQLERCHRDVHAAMQHIIIQRFWLEEAGRVKFGLEPTNPLFAL